MDKEDRPVEIKDLNKTQLILLALLLSFVTSIATGIVTVTLMQQAPTAVTQPINRIVQQTIEKVVPDYSPATTETVVVKEDDLVVDAVTKTRANFAVLLASKDAVSPIGDAYSIGGGAFLIASAPIDQTLPYTIKEGNAFLDAKATAVSPLGFSLVSTDSADPANANLPAASFGKDSDIKAGQTAVIISSGAISKAVVQSVQTATDASKDSYDSVALDPEPTVAQIGSFVADLDGNVIGIVVPASAGAQAIGIDAVAGFIAAQQKVSAVSAPSATMAPQS